MRRREFLQWAVAAGTQAPFLSCFASWRFEEYDQGRPNMSSEAELLAEFQAVEDRFNVAMISNDPDLIAECITDDWVLVTQESGPLSREIVLGIIGGGVLTHSTMTKQIHRAKRYGDVAVVTSRGQNTGTYQGEPIAADEWITDVYVRTDDGWRCVITHLTPAMVGG